MAFAKSKLVNIVLLLGAALWVIFPDPIIGFIDDIIIAIIGIWYAKKKWK